MKSKITTLFIIYRIVTPSIFNITFQTNGVIGFLNPSELYTMPDDEYVKVDLNDFDTTNFGQEVLYPIIPYWHGSLII